MMSAPDYNVNTPANLKYLLKKIIFEYPSLQIPSKTQTVKNLHVTNTRLEKCNYSNVTGSALYMDLRNNQRQP
jgi:hypothetical protein